MNESDNNQKSDDDGTTRIDDSNELTTTLTGNYAQKSDPFRAPVSDTNKAVVDDSSKDSLRIHSLPVVANEMLKKTSDAISNSLDGFKKKSDQSFRSFKKKADRRSSSLDLRKIPVNILLKPDIETGSDVSDLLNENTAKDEFNGKRNFFKMTCLNPKYCLRTQLFLSFGTVNAITIIFVVAICIVFAFTTGNKVQEINSEVWHNLSVPLQGTTTRYLAESLDQKIMPMGLVNILAEATQDRFEGYPNPSDDSVPFFDIDSQTNKYPIVGAPMPPDWQVDTNVHDRNFEEHLQGRWDFYKSYSAVGTTNAMFHIQGLCDPSETDPNGDGYWPNCTNANNNISTGGVVSPNPTTQLIYRKGGDLVPLMKSLFESNPNMRDLGLYFANNGSGATVNYPHYSLSTSTTYTSVGCDWMKNQNKYDPSRPIGTQEMIDKCNRTNGDIISTRVYTPLDRGWCRDQALNPKKLIADVYPDAFNNDSWVLSLGKAVYDRATKEFIACSYVGFTMDHIAVVLNESKVTPNSEVSLVRWNEEGLVVASTVPNGADGTKTIDQLSVGLTIDSYQYFYNLVNYTSDWDPETVRQEYEKAYRQDRDFIVASYPIPTLPGKYDSSYRPEFLVVVSTSIDDMFEVDRKVIDECESEVKRVALFSLVVGAAGFVVVTMFIFLMAKSITSPLSYMNSEAEEVLNNFGDSKDCKDIISKKNPKASLGARCSPKTELSDVLVEFNKMLSSFSRSSMVKSDKGKHKEIRNCFALREDFLELYKSRKQSGFAYNLDTENEEIDGCVHLGPNLVAFGSKSTSFYSKKNANVERKQSIRSPLFLWTVLLIATPLLVTTITISAVNMSILSKRLSHSIDSAENEFLTAQMKTKGVHAKLRASFVSNLASISTRDLYLLSRYSNWVLFGGLDRADSFTSMTTGTEECKNYSSNISQCSYVQDNSFCDCAWNDLLLETCQNYPNGSRHLQVSYFYAESNDVLVDGDRYNSSFPNVSYSPATTAWWRNATEVPGSEKGLSAVGYDTTYDRLRVISAVPLMPVLRNYDNVEDNLLETFTAFEADGLVVGYNGCRNTRHAGSSMWKSTESNGAAKLRPALCPIGKYGYDPRCRAWYHTGRNLSLMEGSALHVTAPYEFASTPMFAQTATAPLMDPQTGENVGQVLYDFSSNDVFKAMSSDNTVVEHGGFPVLIAAQDVTGSDTVIGPDYSANESAKPISEVVLPNDHDCDRKDCNDRISKFNKIVESMKASEENTTQFTRLSSTGEIERLRMAYAPVSVKSMRPLNSSDFSRGVNISDYLIYSLGLVETEEGLRQPFVAASDKMDRQLIIAIIVLSVVIFIGALIVVFISYRVAISITVPTLYLLDLIRRINRLDVHEDPPPVEKTIGSREVLNVSNTMETLYTVVRSANLAFYAGDLESAYLVLADALRLFRRLGNKKAIGVASNNIGNTLLGIYRTMTEVSGDLEVACGLTKKEIITRGIAHYHEAIELGEKAYDDYHDAEGWSPGCLDWMQHLSNRYFNRAMFLLTVKDDHDNPSKLEELGMRDLEITRDMDQEVMEYGQEIGWSSDDRLEKLFLVYLIRLRGLNMLLKMGYPDDWDIEEKLDDAFNILRKESKRESSELFRNITVSGRMQEIETELMKYKMAKGDIETAAKIAIRMLVEDGFTFVEALSQALEVLLAYVDISIDETSEEELKLTIQSQLQDQLYSMSRGIDEEAQSTAYSGSFAGCELPESVRRSLGRSSLSKPGDFKSSATTAARSSISRWKMSESGGKFVTMEDF